MMTTIRLPVYLFLSFFLTLLPIPVFLKICWPNWMILFFFWLANFRPQTMLYIWMWGLGLCLDVLQSSLLGVHVLGFLAMHLLISQYRRKFLMYPVIQQAILVSMATAIYTGITEYFFVDMNLMFFAIYTIQVSVLTGFLWPWLEYLNKSSLLLVQKN
jgi:rod shape-determining protein MreD